MKTPNDLTSKLRTLYAILFAITVLIGLAGWIVGRDPSQLLALMGPLTAALGIGEASNIGKRATFKSDAL